MSLRAAPALDTSTPLNFFTGTANLFLQNAGYNFTVTNIPIYPTNYYTPALHRLLQLAANLYDATTNRVFDDGSSPNGPFYPSVFRPIFGNDGTNIFINGYVEDISSPGDPNAAYQYIPFSLPEELDAVIAALQPGATNPVNIYGIPWVIGARKGFPTFNEFAMASVSQLTRKIQVVYNSQTNVQYSLGISNVMAIEAWNSYAGTYSRGVSLVGVAALGISLSNQDTGELLVFTNFNRGVGTGPISFGKISPIVIPSNSWAGFARPNFPGADTNSFKIPLYTNVIFLTNSVYHPSTVPHFTQATNFDLTGPNFGTPHFILNYTSRIQYAMVDTLTGRVIDYVTLGGTNMSFTRDLAEELQGIDNDGGPGGVWLTNVTNGVVLGIQRQILISLGLSVPNFNSPSDWITSQLQAGDRAQSTAIFSAFLNGSGGPTNAMQAPFTPTRKVAMYYTWQANDPLVHYNLSDLSPTNIITYPLPFTDTNYLVNIRQVNQRYLPWNNTGNPQSRSIDPLNAANLAVKDPLVINSDSWHFPSNQPLNLSASGQVHRGTPWQTVYLKSTGTSHTNWQKWSGNTNAQDALLSEPTNDWALAAVLLPLLAPQDPHLLYGFNQPDPNTWTPLFQGLTVFTNTPTNVIPLVIDTTFNSNAILQIISGISAQRASQPGQLFNSVTPIFAVPQLSVASPFLNPGSANFLTDAAYESLASQVIPLLRPDPIGSMINAGGATQFQFTGFDGYAYIVQASTNLRDWTPLATEYPTNGAFAFMDTDATNFPGRYYRTVLAP